VYSLAFHASTINMPAKIVLWFLAKTIELEPAEMQTPPLKISKGKKNTIIYCKRIELCSDDNENIEQMNYQS